MQKLEILHIPVETQTHNHTHRRNDQSYPHTRQEYQRPIRKQAQRIADYPGLGRHEQFGLAAVFFVDEEGINESHGGEYGHWTQEHQSHQRTLEGDPHFVELGLLGSILSKEIGYYQ